MENLLDVCYNQRKIRLPQIFRIKVQSAREIITILKRKESMITGILRIIQGKSYGTDGI